MTNALIRAKAVRKARLVLAAAVGAIFLTSAAANGASPGIVISQVYAGGGNAGATYTNDFVELFNRGSSAVDVSGWSVQYASASSTSWQVTALAGSIAPGRHYLVQLASAAAIGSALPTPDATGTTNLAASGGKVALASDATALSCGAAAGSCSVSSLVADLVGYGTATDYEGGDAAPGLSNTTALVRSGGGCDDTDSSSADFASGTPAPRSSAAAAAPCASTPPATGGVSQSTAVNVNVQPVLSLSLDQPSLGFGSVAPGSTPSPLAEKVTVVSNDPSGYALTVHRSAFTPADLPLGISAVAPAGAQLGSGVSAGTLAGVPIAPAPDLLLGSSTAATAGAGDAWPTSVGFVTALPSVTAGLHTATVTFTVIGR
jgi:hypothetical protein